MWSVHQQQCGDKAGELVQQVPRVVGALLRPAAQEELQEPGGGGAGGHPQPSGGSAVSRVCLSVRLSSNLASVHVHLPRSNSMCTQNLSIQINTFVFNLYSFYSFFVCLTK